MSETGKQKQTPRVSQKGQAKQAERAERLADQLRANLKKRKAQQRLRDTPEDPGAAS